MKKEVLIPLVGPAIILFVWQLIYLCEIVDSFLLPSPFQVVSKLFSTSNISIIKDDLRMTLIRTLVSFIIAAGIGIPLGLLLSIKKRLYRSVEFIIDFFRSTPSTALFPLFLFLFGISDSSKIASASFGAGMVIVFNTAYGVMNSKKIKRQHAALMGASKLEIFKQVIVWESLPQTFVGLRTALSLTLVIIVVTEMFIGTDAGLGRRIIDYQITYELPAMYSVIIITGITGYILNLLFALTEKKFIHWKGSQI